MRRRRVSVFADCIDCGIVKRLLAEAGEGMPWQVGGDELEGRWRDRVGP